MHTYIDRTAVLCTQFESVCIELGDVRRAMKDRREWLEAQGWKELDKYREGYRAMICSVCGKIQVYNPNSKNY